MASLTTSFDMLADLLTNEPLSPEFSSCPNPRQSSPSVFLSLMLIVHDVRARMVMPSSPTLTSWICQLRACALMIIRNRALPPITLDLIR